MDRVRSKPKPIKRLNREKKQNRNVVVPQVSQSLPANYYSDRCPRAPLHRPIEARHVPPTLNLPPSPADFQNDYLERVRRRSKEVVLTGYNGPAFSSYPTSSNKYVSGLKSNRPNSTLSAATSQSKSSDKPRSLTALCILSYESKDNRFSYDRRSDNAKKRFRIIEREDERKSEERSNRDEDDLDEVDLPEVELPEDEVFVIDSIDL